MRLALLSDIHGNPIALEAVLGDIEASGSADAFWMLGDHISIGHDPVAVLQRITALPNARFVRGNNDRCLFEDLRPDLIRRAHERPEQLSGLFEAASSYAWTVGCIAANGWLAWTEALPLEERLTLPDGTRLLGVHAAPGKDDGYGIYPTMTDAELTAALAGCEADLVVVGHTHWPMERFLDGVRVVNLGSVSNPVAPDLRASYAMLEADEAGYHIELRRVEYDHEAVIAAVQQSRHPGGEFIITYQRGLVQARWKREKLGG